MNAPILRLFGLFLVLFAALVAMTSWNSVLSAQDLQDNELNRRGLFQEQMIRRGLLRARDETLLARSTEGEAGLFEREYTEEAQSVAHVLGYSFALTLGRAGLERSRNDALSGERSELTSVLDELRGRRREGDNVITTLDLDAQRAALSALQGRRGSVVALEPDTGKVRVMASVPTYDPNDLGDRERAAALQGGDVEGSPLLNRATQAGYPPGSTFKVVTAAAALDSGEYTPSTTVDGSTGVEISGVPLANSGGTDFGPVDLTTALTNSVNTVWAQVAEDLGAETMAEYMDRFGFSERPPLDYPAAQLFASGVYDGGELLPVDSGEVDIGRMAIGQERLRVTPLQMAMVAAAVANAGVLMQPRLTDRIVDRDGRVVEDIGSEQGGRVMSAESAQQLTSMMGDVVREGTGTAAALEGVDVAGKTGTAEIDPERDINLPAFIAFAPERAPKIAIAVFVERDQGGQGGTVAAPIAKQVLEELL
jgi:peptidoglycan glycosyltransferase